MKCPNCNKENDENKNFCSGCGIKLGDYTLIITRQKKARGFAISFPVFVDDLRIGNLANGKSITYRLTKGNHKVIIDSVEKKLEQGILLDDEHKCVEIVIYAGIGAISARPNLVNIEYSGGK